MTRQEYAAPAAFQERAAERCGHFVDDTSGFEIDVDDSRRDDLAGARGLLVGAACGLALWAALFFLVWRTL